MTNPSDEETERLQKLAESIFGPSAVVESITRLPAERNPKSVARPAHTKFPLGELRTFEGPDDPITIGNVIAFWISMILLVLLNLALLVAAGILFSFNVYNLSNGQNGWNLFWNIMGAVVFGYWILHFIGPYMFRFGNNKAFLLASPTQVKEFDRK